MFVIVYVMTGAPWIVLEGIFEGVVELAWDGFERVFLFFGSAPDDADNDVNKCNTLAPPKKKGSPSDRLSSCCGRLHLHDQTTYKKAPPRKSSNPFTDPDAGPPQAQPVYVPVRGRAPRQR